LPNIFKIGQQQHRVIAKKGARFFETQCIFVFVNFISVSFMLGHFKCPLFSCPLFLAPY